MVWVQFLQFGPYNLTTPPQTGQALDKVMLEILDETTLQRKNALSLTQSIDHGHKSL